MPPPHPRTTVAMATPTHGSAERRAAAVRERLKLTRSLAKTRRKRSAVDSRLEVLVLGVQVQGSLDQQRLLFFALRIREATLHGADCLARLVVVEPDAFGAEFRIDYVDVVAFADGFVRALWLASAAVDAVRRYVRRHGASATPGPPLS